ncbi:MAG: OmpA family protein [Cyclobacteriaceae bacterium]
MIGRRIVMVLLLGMSMVIALPHFGTAKPDPTRALLKSGLQRYEQGQYYEAVHFYQKALAVDSTLSEAQYYLGDCYRNLFQYELALQYYQQVQDATYPLLPLNMGLVHKSLGHYNRAEKYFNFFIQKISQEPIEDQQYWLEKAEGELVSLSALQQSPFGPMIDIKISKLPTPINSSSHDLAAIPYRDAKGLIVTSTRLGSKGNQYNDQHGESFSDNFLFMQDSNGWQDASATHRFSTINTSLDEGPGTISADGQKYYFTRYTSKGDYHIYVSDFVNDQWKSPHPLSAPINLPGYISKHPALSDSGDTLFFSSNRPGGYGESDLWMSVYVGGDWQSPVNLGPKVNTAYHETAPHWDARQQAIFFASNGHPGWGGFDLFMTPLLATGLPTQIVNVGKPLNSAKDDTYIWVGEHTGYVTSNRDNATGSFDIYQYQYDNGPKLLLSITSQSLWDTWEALSYSKRTEEEASEAYKFFSSLPTEEQEALQRTVRRRIFEAILSEEDFSNTVLDEAQSMGKAHKDKIQKLVDDQLAFYRSFEIPVWNEDSLRWFSTLSSEEQKHIEKITQMRVLQALLQQTDDAWAEETFTYEALSSEQRTWVEEATNRGMQHFQEVANELVGMKELIQWQTLSPKEKNQLQQELSYRYFSTILPPDETADQALHRYEQLPSELQKNIDRMAYTLISQGKDQSDFGMNEGAFRLDTLSSEDQRSLAALVLYRSEELRKQLDADVNGYARSWEELPKEEKNMIQRSVASRRFTKQVESEFSLKAKSSRQQINLHALLQANPDIVTITGKLKMGSSMAGPVTIALGNRQKQLRTTTEPDGDFLFERVNYQQSQQLIIGEEDNSMTEMLSFYLEELEVTVVQDSQFVESFDNIYFESNRHQLTDKAAPILDRVAAFHQRHPDIRIQIHAYADSVGGQSYNYQLSERRGEAVFQSLIQRGVQSLALRIMPQGKEVIGSAKALAYSRRVEFKITGINTLYNPTRTHYLLSAYPDLDKLAQRYGVTVDQILAANPGVSMQPSPYTIIKIAKKPVQDGL